MTLPKENLATRINQHIGEFDLISLLRVLKHKGYQEKHIRFDSYTSQTSQERIIRSVSIDDYQVLIVVDLGLLGIQTPLPSTMIKEMKVEIGQGTPNDKLLDMLDHSLIINYISHIYPEINSQFFPEWKHTQRQLFLMHNIHSISTLYWLFQQVFPEFSIQSSKKNSEQEINALPITLNQSALGDHSRFGGVMINEAPCLQFKLTLEKEHYRHHVLWVDEVEKRLKAFIYPLLDKREIYLIVSLRLPHRQKALQLSSISILGREIMCDDSKQDTLPQEVYYPKLHQGAVNLAIPETDYTIQWGEPCRIHI